MNTRFNGLGFDFCAFLDYDSSSDVQLYEIGTYKCKSDYSYGPIIRPRGILHYVISGKGILIINNKKYHIEGKHFFYIPAGVRAFYQADHDDPWFYCWCHLGGRIVNEVFHEIGWDEYDSTHELKFLPNGTERNFEKIILDIFYGYSHEYYCIGKLYEILDYLRTAYAVKQENDMENLQLKYVRTIIKYIQLKYSEHIKVDDIAKSFNLNRSYLSRLFHEATGSTIQEYIMSYRIKAATDLLKNTDNTISYIASAVGYTDVFTFSKAFKKRIGKTPTEFRKI
ncbi:MAG: AraC family transcriptional regulator [Lachnospiraceae bacterium]|nr:AraC family transcriptional regulator [Lachnospiraceae bacterium]